MEFEQSPEYRGSEAGLKKFAVALIRYSLSDALGYNPFKKGRQWYSPQGTTQDVDNAILFFLDEDNDDDPMSLDICCEILGIDAGRIRRFVKGQLSDKNRLTVLFTHRVVGVEMRKMGYKSAEKSNSLKHLRNTMGKDPKIQEKVKKLVQKELQARQDTDALGFFEEEADAHSW